MSFEVFAFILATCLGCGALLLGLALLMARYERSLEAMPRVGPARRAEDLVLSIVFAIVIGAVGTSLAGSPHLLVAGLAIYAGLSLWLWLNSIGAGEKRGRGGVIRPAPRPRGRAPRRGRA